MNAMNDANVLPILVPIDVAAKMIGRGTTFIYEAISDGRLNAVKSDKRTLITVESIKEYASNLPPASVKVLRRRRRNGA
jgi:hypothetical protein